MYLFAVISFLQIILFSGFFYFFYTSPLFFCSCKKFYVSFPLAKTAGWLINFNLFLILTFQIKFIKKLLYIPFSLKYNHYYISFYIFLWSIIHVVCHYINFSKLISLQKISYISLFTWGVGFTGHILIICFLLFFIFSLPFFRKYKYHSFIAIHYSLLICVFVFSSIHGSFCFFKTCSEKCLIPTTWIWLFIPVSIFIEIILKYSKKYKIHNVISYPASIMEIQVFLPNNYDGNVVHICCPQISAIEWHPFSVSSKNIDGSYSIFIKIRGNWTKKFSNLLGITEHTKVFNTVYPFIYIDGPFITFPKKTHTILANHTTICIASGIGLTTFHHLLKSISLSFLPIKNTYFIIICRSFDDIEWCYPLLSKLNTLSNFNLHIFFTRESSSINNNNLLYSIGYPNFENIFNFINLIHNHESPPYIFYSGKHKIINDIVKYKNKYISNAKFYEL